MRRRPSSRLTGALIIAVALCGMASGARSEDDFLATIINAFSGNQAPREARSEPVMRLPFATEGGLFNAPMQPRQPSYSTSQAYCVRTCDGRYFPISASDGKSRAASCNSFCPASETKIVYGSGIDHAVTESGKSYSALPNAFRYRIELVAGCTCNGKDQIGLAPVTLEADPTLRKGDIVAGAAGLMVTQRGYDKRGAALDMSPASRSIRSKYERLPVMASD
jgi:hypothetical protein